MCEWERQVQTIVDEVDERIKRRDDEALALAALARRLGYSEFYATRKFREIAGMPLRDYLRMRKLAFALKEVRDTRRGILDIALDYGFSSHETFTRAFKAAYGVTPSACRAHSRPVVLRTKLTAFDRYLFGLGEVGEGGPSDGVQTYFVRLPAHRFLYVENRESNGYWDFWQRQSAVSGRDHDTVCGLLDAVKGKLDDDGGSESNSGGGQVMAYRWDPQGRLCDWGIPRTECYGARLPADWRGEVPSNLLIMDVPAAEYLVFEHSPFDYERKNRSVEEAMERAMAPFDFADTGYRYDETPGRLLYLFFDPSRCWKYVRPVCGDGDA